MKLSLIFKVISANLRNRDKVQIKFYLDNQFTIVGNFILS